MPQPPPADATARPPAEHLKTNALGAGGIASW